MLRIDKADVPSEIILLGIPRFITLAMSIEAIFVIPSMFKPVMVWAVFVTNSVALFGVGKAVFTCEVVAKKVVFVEVNCGFEMVGDSIKLVGEPPFVTKGDKITLITLYKYFY
jgi:hypothetical protein